jgi:hypothetical protein
MLAEVMYCKTDKFGYLTDIRDSFPMSYLIVASRHKSPPFDGVRQFLELSVAMNEAAMQT